MELVRFDKDNLCPNCSSGNHITGSQRCWGVSYQKSFICTRDSGIAKKVPSGFLHWYDDCDCGRNHGDTMLNTDPTNSSDLSGEQIKKNYAEVIWNNSYPINNTTAQKYLHNRRLYIDDSSVLRYNPSIPHFKTNTWHESLICKISDEFDHLTGIQRIYLSGGFKANIEPNKMTLGSALTNAVRFGGEPKETLGIAEGIETALTVHSILNIPVWACLGSTFLHRLKLPSNSTLKNIMIFADPDSAGAESLAKAQDTWSSRYNVIDRRPRNTTKDYNDLLMQDEQLTKHLLLRK